MNWKCHVSVRVSLIWRWVSSFSDFHTPLYFPEEAAVYRRPQVSTNDTTIHFPFRSENHITLKRPPLFCCTLGFYSVGDKKWKAGNKGQRKRPAEPQLHQPTQRAASSYCSFEGLIMQIAFRVKCRLRYLHGLSWVTDTHPSPNPCSVFIWLLCFNPESLQK